MAPIVTRRAHAMRRLSGAELGTDTDNDTRNGTLSAGQEGNGPGSYPIRALAMNIHITPIT